MINLKYYIEICRPTHWIKNIFILPGVLLAIFFSPDVTINYLHVALGFIATCLVASGYYALNEILDAKFDKHHPEKKFRPVPSGKINIKLGYALWIALTSTGVLIAYSIGIEFLISMTALVIMSLIYNVSPIRMKDKPFLDVIVESTNNPLRLLIGWYSTDIHAPATLSLLVGYWMFGAFLMAVKRYAELKFIEDRKTAALYRKSFGYYTDESLLVSILFYAIIFSFALGIFIARYRIELIVATPFIGLSMGMYLHQAMVSGELAQNPERILKFKFILIPMIITMGVLFFSLFFDMPIIGQFFENWHNNPVIPK